MPPARSMEVCRHSHRTVPREAMQVRTPTTRSRQTRSTPRSPVLPGSREPRPSARSRRASGTKRIIPRAKPWRAHRTIPSRRPSRAGPVPHRVGARPSAPRLREARPCSLLARMAIPVLPLPPPHRSRQPVSRRRSRPHSSTPPPLDSGPRRRPRWRMQPQAPLPSAPSSVHLQGMRPAPNLSWVVEGVHLLLPAPARPHRCPSGCPSRPRCPGRARPPIRFLLVRRSRFHLPPQPRLAGPVPSRLRHLKSRSPQPLDRSRSPTRRQAHHLASAE